jgi:hypothetical protein
LIEIDRTIQIPHYSAFWLCPRLWQERPSLNTYRANNCKISRIWSVNPSCRRLFDASSQTKVLVYPLRNLSAIFFHRLTINLSLGSRISGHVGRYRRRWTPIAVQSIKNRSLIGNGTCHLIDIIELMTCHLSDIAQFWILSYEWQRFVKKMLWSVWKTPNFAISDKWHIINLIMAIFHLW